MRAADTEVELRANELYWTSEMSVNQIAEELDLSKGSLYELIRPRPAGLACPACSEELLYPNRTARDGDHPACPSCGWKGRADEAISLGGDGAVTPPRRHLPDEEGDDAPAPVSRRPGLDPRTRTLVGGALLGAAAGLALVLWNRRR